MTAPFSLSSIDSASLEWPDLPGLDPKLDVLVPTPPALPSGTLRWQQFGTCIDELAATKALTELLDARTRSMHDRADMCLRATFTIECSPVERAPLHAVRKFVSMQYKDAGPGGHGYVSPHGRPQGSPYSHPRGDFLSPPAEDSAMSVQAWLANLAPLATLAFLLGAWFVWLH
jgi:hypothetical protein